eukprot:GHVR01012219.1.p1 GENE.GHVR01012219.1~~GHVR01012219.1.p1  ORF type:complete len:485 (-),score=114.48 GHVR01012219.1:480-1934(-)
MYIRLLLLLSILKTCISQIKVISPKELVDEFSTRNGETISGSTATFGAPMYGDTKTGRLVYAPSPSTYCNHDYSGDAKVDDINDDTAETLHIVVVDRGNCSFVTKVKVAQDYYSASAVIIVDNGDRSVDDIHRIILADDGHGSSINIPSVLITKADGDKLKDMLLKSNTDPSKQVLVELAWDIPQESIVTLEFWADSGKEASYKFLREFAKSAIRLEYRLKFIPHYHVFKVRNDYNNLCWKNMPNGMTDKVCAEDPDGNGPITGSDVVNEDLRQLCILKNYSDSNAEYAGSSYSLLYWKYIVGFYDISKGCHISDTKNNILGYTSECSYRVMTDAGIDINKIKTCENDTENAYMMLKDEVDNMAWAVLALRINGWRFSGTLDDELVIKALCQAYVTEPSVCTEIKRQHGMILYEGFGFGSMFLIACLLLVIVAIAFAVYQHYLQTSVRAALREEVMMEVKTQMADYQPLRDDEINKNSGRPLIL